MLASDSVETKVENETPDCAQVNAVKFVFILVLLFILFKTYTQIGHSKL